LVRPRLTQTQYNYEPFGKTVSTGASSSNSILYTGRENDATGLYYYRARYYNPTVGRFVSEDPINFTAGVNFYQYAYNRPTGLRDPEGRDPVIGSIVGFLAGSINGGMSAKLTGGNTEDVINAAVLGGVMGGLIGGIEPTPGIVALALIGGTSGGIGDIIRQKLGGRAQSANR
jgi:RHS repeat-associated protein